MHHIPGRLRVKYSHKILSKIDFSALDALKKYVDELPAIREIRVNGAGFTAVISYDASIISPDEWNAMFHQDNPSNFETIFAKLTMETKE